MIPYESGRRFYECFHARKQGRPIHCFPLKSPRSEPVHVEGTVVAVPTWLPLSFDRLWLYTKMLPSALLIFE